MDSEPDQRHTEELYSFVNELQRVSDEQSFGVVDVGAVSASTPPSSPGATVIVDLLERRSIKIKLSPKGYRVRALSPFPHPLIRVIFSHFRKRSELSCYQFSLLKVISDGSATRGRLFETIEDLLQEESPQWSAKRIDAIMLKLKEIAGINDDVT